MFSIVKRCLTENIYLHAIVFILPGYQPPLELLTQLLTQGGVYDRQRQEFQPMEEALLLAAATLPTLPGNKILAKV